MAIAVAAVVLGLLVAWTAYGTGHLADSAPRLVAGWIAVGCGLVGWSRAGWSRSGPLLVAAGLLWFLGEFRVCLSVEPLSHRCVDLGAARTIAELLGWLWLGVLAHAVVTLPDGHAGTWRRLPVAAGYVLAMAIPAWPVAVPLSTAALALALTLASICVLVTLLAADARRVGITPDRAVGLGGALAGVLGDPSMRIAIHDAAGGRWLDPGGQPIQPLVPGEGQVATSISPSGVPVAVITHDAATLADPSVRSGVLLAVELAAHNVRLRGDLEAQLDEIAASRGRLLTAGLRERQALGAQVAVEVEQPLAALAAGLEAVAATGRANPHLPAAQRELDLARTDIHDLALGLYPARLVVDGIPGALGDLAARAANPVAVDVTGEPRPDPAIEAAVVFLCAEALTNAARHAPGARVRIDVAITDVAVNVTIADDGPGSADERLGSGLRGLRDRVQALGGRLAVESPPGMGTRLAVTIPVAHEARRTA